MSERDPNAENEKAARSKGGRYNSITVINRFFETVDVFVSNAGLQAKIPKHSATSVNRLNILQYVTDGEGTLECGGKSYRLVKNTLFLLPKGTKVKYYANKLTPYRYYWISFSGVYADILLTQSGLSPETPVRVVPSPAMKRAFKRIYEYLKESQSKANVDLSLQPKILAAFYDIFSVLLENRNAARAYSPNELVNRAVDMMNSEFSRGISVNDVCSRLFLNRTYFSVLFKKQMNVSPADYLLNLRFNEACKLLKQTALPVQAVADAVGMRYDAFFKFFKARMNATPTEYRSSPL